jgi:hypothetical protein
VTSGAARRGTEGAGALVAEEIVAGKYVIDLKAVRAGIPLADVALEEALAVDEIDAPAIVEEPLGSRTPTGLTG